MLTKRSWWLVLLFLGLVLVLIAQFKGRSGAFQVYRPTGYVAEVNELIAAGKLSYDCEAEKIVSQRLNRVDQFFLDNSYLADDIRSWTAGDPRPFIVEREALRGGGCRGELLRANPTYHNQRLPTYAADRWKGSLFLRHGSVSTILTSAERTLEVSSPPWRRLPLPAKAFEEVRFGTGDPGSRSPKLGFTVRGRDRMFASLQNIGDQVVLESFESRPEMTLNGCSYPLGWRIRMETGDLLRVGNGVGFDEHYVVETGLRSGLVSFVSEVNGEPRRRTLSDRLAMAKDIAWAIDAVVVAGLPQDGEGEAASEDSDQPETSAPRGGRSDFDVYLTLDPFLNQRLETTLSDFAGNYRRPLRAAVTLMEADSGRVLALASFPTARDADRLDPRKAWDQREQLLHNHNFLQHQIGSATKPFLASAALAARPQLARLKTACVPADTSSRDLLGYTIGNYNLPSDCRGGDEQRLIDFTRFLTVSSNRYMLYLGLLAMAEWQGPAPTLDRSAELLSQNARWTLGGSTFDRRPTLPIIRKEAGGLIADLRDEKFFRAFRDLYGHQVEYKKVATVEGLDQRLWQPVIDLTVASSRSNSLLSFSTVTPEKVDFRANLVQSFRQDLYTLLLGNGNNRWSNVQLAESLARLATGQQVQAQLIERITAPGPDGERVDLWNLEEQRADTPWDLPEKARNLVVNAMRTVVEDPRGTGRRLWQPLQEINQAAPNGVKYRLFGKTGTPTMLRRSVDRSPTQPAPEAIQTYTTGIEQVESAVLILAIERVEGAEREVLTTAVYIEAQGESREAVSLVRELLDPIIQSYWPEDWLKQQDI